MFFHRLMFAFMLMAAFWAGVLDAGRRDLLNEKMTDRLLQMTLVELTQIRVM